MESAYKVYGKIREQIKAWGEVLFYSILSQERTTFFMIRKLLFCCLKRHKSVIGFYGECHMVMYSGYMKTSKLLRRHFLFVFAGDINQISRRLPRFVKDSTIWHKCDFLVFNPLISVEEGVPELSMLKNWVKPECRMVSVSNLVFDGYMPQHTNRVFVNDRIFIWGDKNLNKVICNSDVDTTTTIQELSRDDYYSQTRVISHFNRAIERLHKLEQNCDVKIADYIERNGKDRVLFYSTTHPENEVMREITRRIISHIIADSLVEDAIIVEDVDLSLHSHGEVVYPSVYKWLGIPSAFRTRRINPGSKGNICYSFEEYIEAYIKMGRRVREESNEKRRNF